MRGGGVLYFAILSRLFWESQASAETSEKRQAGKVNKPRILWKY